LESGLLNISITHYLLGLLLRELRLKVFVDQHTVSPKMVHAVWKIVYEDKVMEHMSRQEIIVAMKTQLQQHHNIVKGVDVQRNAPVLEN